MNRNVVTILAVLALVVGAGLGVAWLAARDRAHSTAAPETSAAPRTPAVPVAPEALAPLVREERAPAAQPVHDAAPAPLAEPDLALAGRVLAAEDGAPLAAARVAARTAEGATLADAETDEQGRFRIDFGGAAPDAVDLAASFPGRETRVLRGARIGGQESVPDLLLPKGFTVLGSVLALRDRHPVEDAEVELSSTLQGFELGALDDATEEDGAFDFLEVTDLPRDALRLTVVADGFVTEQRTLDPLDDAATSLTVEVLLVDAISIWGEVYDGVAEKPIAGAHVELDSSRPEWVEETIEAATDDEGRFKVELREFPVHDACLFAGATGRQPKCVRLSEIPSIVDHVDLGRQFLFPPVVLRGSVVEQGSDRHPNAGLVHVRPRDVPDEIAERFQDATALRNDGTFELALEHAPTGCTLEIVVEAEGYLPGRKELQIQAQAHPAPVAGLKVELARAMRLSATVVGAGAAPLPAARVQWWLPAAEGRVRLGGETETDGEGQFDLDVPGESVRDIRVSVEFHGRRAAWPALALATTGSQAQQRPVLALPGAAAPPPESDR